jgi:hypothetical protein
MFPFLAGAAGVVLVKAAKRPYRIAQRTELKAERFAAIYKEASHL